jgi:hypothetical protein
MKPIAIFALCTSLLGAQVASDQWKTLQFLEGTWEAKTQGGSAGATSTGDYIFIEELNGHILARHSASSGCKGPADFNCDHGDLLYIYREAPDQPLKAIYFDNEGHVIQYTVTTPVPGSVVFESEQYRLIYERKGNVMSGKFQMRMPGKTEWISYLEWSGPKK